MAAGDPGSPARYYSSIAVETALSGSIPAQAQGAANTAFIVASVSGFPSSYPYTLIVDPDTSKEEVVTVTAGSGTTLSVTRGSDNTQGVAHSAGAVVRHGVSGRDFRESETHIAARGYDIDQTILDLADQTHVHGIVTGEGVVVGTLKTQTLTNKTLTSPVITNPSISGAGVDASIVFEGATADAYETTLTVVDPTQDNTITLPNTTGTVVIATAVQTLTNKTMGDALNAGGYKITNLATPTDASDAVRKDFADAQVAAAATSAASAAASATAAATSATSAANSASTAAASVATIAGYATSAANSASAAATSATSAAASATEAATSATSAATSSSFAITSADSAALSATSAATSATSASNSATAAGTSATSAAASATAAATSATSAAASATTAANSVATIAGYATSAANSASAAATSAASAATSATSAATTYDDFDDRYLGSKSSPPSVDNDGNTLLVGAIYWNSTLNNMYVWSGSAWVQIATTSVYSAPTLGSTTIDSGTTYSTITGLTLSGGLASADPTTNLGLATKQYVDAVVTQINYHESVVAATTTNLGVTYSNGSSGVGATLTADTLREFNTLDGESVSVGQRVLIKDQTNQIQNGIYTLTNNGSAGVTAWVLTRATDADNNPSGEMKNGDELFCSGGTVNHDKSFINSTTVDPIVIGTTAITFSEYYAGLPAQTGNSGKYLTTDGTTPSWGVIDTTNNANIIMAIMGAY
jgi:hypothetical protein